jgi:hypothetical protein
MELRRGLSNEQQFAKCLSGIGLPDRQLERADIFRGKVWVDPQLRRIAGECYRKSRREAAMTGQIKRSIGSTTLVTMLLVSFGAITVLANTARADDCIAAPNSPSPPGKHWFYRLDWATKRKCWYVGPLGRSVQEAPSAAKRRARHLGSVPDRPNQQLQADDRPLSSGEAGPSSPPFKAIAVKPNAASVSATADEAIASFPKISAPQASTSSETVAKGSAPGSSAGPASGAAADNAALPTPEASAPQASVLLVTDPPAVVQESIAVPTASHLGRLSGDVEPTFAVGELTANARLPTRHNQNIGKPNHSIETGAADRLQCDLRRFFGIESGIEKACLLPQGPVLKVSAGLALSLLYLALGLALVGILSFAVPKLFKKVAASMALRLIRGRDSNAESGALQQADAFVLREAGCARDSEEPNGGAPTLHDGADVTKALASMALRLDELHSKISYVQHS